MLRVRVIDMLVRLRFQGILRSHQNCLSIARRLFDLLAMYSLSLSILLCFLCSHTIAASDNPQQPKKDAPPILYTATVHQLPPSPTASSKPLATLIYHPLYPELSKVQSFAPPKNTTDPLATTQVAIYFPNNDPTSDRFRSSATATNGFYAPYKGRLRILVDPEDGTVLSASWRAWRPKDDGQQANRLGDFEIMTRKQAPPVVFDISTKEKSSAAQNRGQGAQQGAEGEEEVVEKTFFQK